MKHWLLLLALAGCSAVDNADVRELKTLLRTSGDVVVTKQDETIGILRENTTALTSIADAIETLKASQTVAETPKEEEVIQSELTPVVAKESQPSVTTDSTSETTGVILSTRQWYLVSEPWCAACPAAKAKFIAKGWPESNVLTINQCQSRFGFRVPYVPYEFGEPIQRAVVGTQYNSAPRALMSHSDQVALHNSLHGGGQWTWPGNLSEHLQSVHGVSTNATAQNHGTNSNTGSRSNFRTVSCGQNYNRRARSASRQRCPAGGCP
jgi:hypothetical protein